MPDEPKINLDNYVHVELGKCAGIALLKRGAMERSAVGDNHVQFVALVEDDGLWHVSKHGMSSAWLQDSIAVHQRAMNWVLQNCDPDPTGYGWVFRTHDKGDPLIAAVHNAYRVLRQTAVTRRGKDAIAAQHAADCLADALGAIGQSIPLNEG